MNTVKVPNDTVEFMGNRIKHHMDFAKEHHTASGVWPQHEAFATDFVRCLQRMVDQMNQKEIIHLRLEVAIWLTDYNDFKIFENEAETLEKLLK